METELARWGNSLAVRIPKEALQRAGLREGDSLTLSSTRKGEIQLRSRRKRKPKSLTLEQMVARITPENMHSRLDWGPPQGKELL
jgi:antitoxin MazE